MDTGKEGLIPENTEGSKTDVAHELSLSSVNEAKEKYAESKNRLLNITQWHEYAGKGTADFCLTDSTGNPVSRLAEEGDFFRINIPGPGSKTGDGFDWVQISSIVESSENDNNIEWTAIKVHPASNPQNQDEHIAHFFEADASSTFMVKRIGITVVAEVHGRNEKANTNSENLIDKARNAVVALGAMLGFSELQWKALAKGLVE